MSDEPTSEQPASALKSSPSIHRWYPLGFAAMAGFVLFLSAPPFMLWPLNFLASFLLALSVYDATPRAAFFRGLVAGIFYWLFAATWLVATVTRFTGLPVVAGVALFLGYCVAQSLMLAVQCMVAARASTVLGKTLAVVGATLMAESFVSAIFAWQFAAPLVDAPWLAQSAELITVSGVSALVHGFSTSGLHFYRSRNAEASARRSARNTFASVAVFGLAMIAFGAVRTSQWSERTRVASSTRVALVQPSIPPLVRWDPQAASDIVVQLHQLERRAVLQHPDLIVLHEGAYPYVLGHRAGLDGIEGPPVFPQVESPPIVFGLMSAGEGETRYNAAFLRNGDGTLSTPVAKRALVPFGESVPLAESMPWLVRIFWRSGGISPGTGSPILTTRSGMRLGILICLEDTLALSGAQTEGSELLVNLTNDAWFGHQTALEEHLLMARWRSIELRRETVRSVNSGITARIDVLGRVVDRAIPNTSTVLMVNALRFSSPTFAPKVARYGGKLAAILLVGAIFSNWIRQRLMSKK